MCPPSAAALSSPGPEFVALAPSTTQAFEEGRLYAPARTPVVLTGATGTGKTFLARYIHAAGPRRDFPFVTRTVAELDSELASSEIFGHERGAFTGAYRRSEGAFGEAAGGTFFLDDVHLATPLLQAKLLRALDSGWYRTVGGPRDLPLRCRIIVGVGQDAGDVDGIGRLLPDFLYRLGQCRIHLAPLAERREEIGPLAWCFLRRCPESTGVPGPERFAPDVVPMLARAPWPGNLRHLEGAVQRAYLHARGQPEVRLEHFDAALLDSVTPPTFQRHGDHTVNRELVEAALEAADWCQVRAADRLGVHRNTVRSYAKGGAEAAGTK